MKQINFFVPGNITVELWSVLCNAHAGCWEPEQVVEYAAKLGYEVSIKQVEALRVLFDEQERMDYVFNCSE